MNSQKECNTDDINAFQLLSEVSDEQPVSQRELAKRLGIAQSRVSDLVRGKWDKFSLEMLITLEARLGRTVRVEFAV